MSQNNHDQAVYALMQPDAHDGYPPSEHKIEMSKVWAAMSLAHEQRTANLIALFAVESDCLPALAKGGFGDAAWIEAAEQITERLGL